MGSDGTPAAPGRTKCPKAEAPPRLLDPVDAIAGVGGRTLALLDRLLDHRTPGRGRPTRFDLLSHLPTGLDGARVVPNLAAARTGERVAARLRVETHLPGEGKHRPYRIRCFDGAGFVHLVYFARNPGYLKALLPEGVERWFGGVVRRFGVEVQLTHPDVLKEPEGAVTADVAAPVYRLTMGLNQAAMRRLIARALDGVASPPDWHDPELRRREAWPDLTDALGTLHGAREADTLEPASPARRRLAYDELLASALALALIQGRSRARHGRATAGDGRLRGAARAALPFAPTGAQEAAGREIAADMASPLRMLRLLQGDVGSGKTLVALVAMLNAVEAGRQAVIMAPTDLLARQHAETLRRLLAPLGLAVDLLTGKEPAAKRRAARARLASGDARLAVGTHALFQESVEFDDLGLVVIDEQHRFGVHQRLDLAAKGAAPDLLVMTATPIPRSLVMTVYGDMAVSRLAEKPPGRKPVTTRVLPLDRLDEIVDSVRRALESGERLYWVCPLIEETDKSDLAAAEARHAALRERFGDRVGLVHGRMGAEAKAGVMDAFKRGTIGVLVATTVVEVGVDVPEAGVIVIEQAERFGLAQLHQLRGRVGRGGRAGACLLLYKGPLGKAARARLEILRETEDGFRIAEDDLRLRGPGEVLGVRQSGLPNFRFVDLNAHADLIRAARQEAKLILARDPDLTTPRGRNLRNLLRLYGRERAIAYLEAG